MSTMVLRALDATIGVGPCEIRDGQQTDVGRSADCGIVLPSKSVSRVHARFLRKDADLVLEDLGSSNGTAVNGSPIHGAVTVRAGDRIRFGSLEFVLEESKPEEDEAATLLAPPEDPETILAPPEREAPPPPPATPSTADMTPSPTPLMAPSVDGAPPPSAAEPAPPPREATSMTVAKPRDPASPAARPAAKTTRDQPAAAGPASPIELALIAAGAYVAVVAVGMAIRWVFG